MNNNQTKEYVLLYTKYLNERQNVLLEKKSKKRISLVNEPAKLFGEKERKKEKRKKEEKKRKREKEDDGKVFTKKFKLAEEKNKRKKDDY